jgi:hypothetical protein
VNFHPRLLASAALLLFRGFSEINWTFGGCAEGFHLGFLVYKPTNFLGTSCFFLPGHTSNDRRFGCAMADLALNCHHEGGDDYDSW